MDCFKYKIQLSERTTKTFLETNLQTTQFKNLRAQASEAEYYMCHHSSNRRTGATEPSVTKACPRQTYVAAMLVP